MSRTIERLALAGWLVLIGLPALATEAGNQEALVQEAHPTGDHHFFAGLKGSYLAGFAHGELHHQGGGGLFFEASVIHHWLELELGARIMTDGHGALLPLDLLAKMPFHLSDTIHPFLGIGPTVIFNFDGDLFFGGVLAGGSYFWFAHSWALVVEANYNLIYEHGVVNELGLNAGIVYGW